MANIAAVGKDEQTLTFKVVLHQALLTASPSATYLARNNVRVEASSLPFSEGAILQGNESFHASSVTDGVNLSTLFDQSPTLGKPIISWIGSKP